jgi:peroxiredoxin
MTRRHLIPLAVLSAVSLGLAGTPVGADLRLGTRAPEFKLDRFGGGKVSLADLRGRVVVLNFWQPRCSACNEMIPHLQQLDQKYADSDVRVVGIVEVKTPEEDVRSFVQDYKAMYPVLLDSNGAVARRYQVTQHPVTLIIDGKGVVRFTHIGFLKGQEKRLEEALDAVLQGKRIARGGLTRG